MLEIARVKKKRRLSVPIHAITQSGRQQSLAVTVELLVVVVGFDLVTKADKNRGAETGESIGKTIGIFGAGFALYQNAQAEDQRFKVCLQEKGYRVMG